MNGKWASFIILFLSTLILGVFATEFHPKPFSAIMISALYGIAYVINSVAYGLDLFRKEQRLLQRVGYHGLVFFRGSDVESSEREKAEKLFIRQTTQGDVGKFVMGIVVLLCIGVAFLIRKKAPDQLQWSTAIHFISIAVLAVSFSMNHYFLSLAINAAAVFIFVSQRIQEPEFSFFRNPTSLFPICYLIFLFGFTGVFYRFLEFFQFGFELKNVRKLMKQGWASGVIFLSVIFLMDALVPDRDKGNAEQENEQVEEKRSIKVVKSIDRTLARWIYGGHDPIEQKSPVTTTTTSRDMSAGAGLSEEEKVIAGFKESLRRQNEELGSLNAQIAANEVNLEKLRTEALGSGESQADRFKKIQELQEKTQSLQGDLNGRLNRIADLEKHIAEKEGRQESKDTTGIGATNSLGAEVDTEKMKRDAEELQRQIAALETQHEQLKSDKAAREVAEASGGSVTSSSGDAKPNTPRLETQDRKEAQLELEREAEETLAQLKRKLEEKQADIRKQEATSEQAVTASAGSEVDQVKEKRDLDELTKKIADLEAKLAREKAEAENVERLGGKNNGTSSSPAAQIPEASPIEGAEDKVSQLERRRKDQEALAQMKGRLEEKEAALRRQKEELRKPEAEPLPAAPKEEKLAEVKEKVQPPEQRILSDVQLEMIVKLAQVLLFGVLAIGSVFGLIYFLNRKSAKDRERKIYQAVVEDPERFQKELKFLDQKGLTPQQEVILKYNLFLRFLRSVNLPKEDWQTVDQFHDDLIVQKSYDSATLMSLCHVFGRVCYGGHRPDAQEVEGFRASLEQLIDEMTLKFKTELSAQIKDEEQKVAA